MYDRNKRVGFHNPTVELLVKHFMQYPLNTCITVSGSTDFFMHVDTDAYTITLDDSSLEECYPPEAQEPEQTEWDASETNRRLVHLMDSLPKGASLNVTLTIGTDVKVLTDGGDTE